MHNISFKVMVVTVIADKQFVREIKQDQIILLSLVPKKSLALKRLMIRVGGRPPLSIFPFIINGITLLGIDSVNCLVDMRMKVWNKVASEWKLDRLEKITTELPSLAALDERIGLILEGKNRGRSIAKIL